MTHAELITKIQEYEALQKTIKEYQKIADDIKEQIKAVLNDAGTEELTVADGHQSFCIRNTSILSQRFDSTKFKQEQPQVYNMYIKYTASTRFSIS